MASLKGYTFDVDAMKSSTCGEIGIAQKGTKKFFAKRINTVVEPDADNPAISRATYEQQNKRFQVFSRRRIRVNTELRTKCGIGGNIINPVDEGVYDHHWYEFTEFVDGAIPESDIPRVIASISEDKKWLCLKTAMSALKTIHGSGIVHGDLKIPNILLAYTSTGKLVAKLIDFDGAFFEDDVPLDSITGTVNYYSPELAIYSSNEDEEFRKKFVKFITTKSDIFTMGLIFHEYLTGEMPGYDSLPARLQADEDAGRFVYPWQIVLQSEGGAHQLKIDNSRITKPAIVALISDMISSEPEDRPTAAECLRRIQTLELPIAVEMWPDDSGEINETVLREKYIGFRKIEHVNPDKTKTKGYEVMLPDGRRYFRTFDQLVDEEVILDPVEWCDPWPSDGFSWNIPVANGRGFVRGKRGTKSGFYILKDSSGKSRTFPLSSLKALNFVNVGSTATSSTHTTPVPRPEPTPVPVPEPVEGDFWPEDDGVYEINTAGLTAKKITFVGPIEGGGKHLYRIEMDNKSTKDIPAKTALLLGVFKKK